MRQFKIATSPDHSMQDDSYSSLSFEASAAASTSASAAAAFQNRTLPSGSGSLGGALQFGDVDKLHALGIKGKASPLALSTAGWITGILLSVEASVLGTK